MRNVVGNHSSSHVLRYVRIRAYTCIHVYGYTYTCIHVRDTYTFIYAYTHTRICIVCGHCAQFVDTVTFTWVKSVDTVHHKWTRPANCRHCRHVVDVKRQYLGRGPSLKNGPLTAFTPAQGHVYGLNVYAYMHVYAQPSVYWSCWFQGQSLFVWGHQLVGGGCILSATALTGPDCDLASMSPGSRQCPTPGQTHTSTNRQ